MLATYSTAQIHVNCADAFYTHIRVWLYAHTRMVIRTYAYGYTYIHVSVYAHTRMVICTYANIHTRIQLFRERLSYKREPYATMPKAIMGNGGFTVA